MQMLALPMPGCCFLRCPDVCGGEGPVFSVLCRLEDTSTDFHLEESAGVLTCICIHTNCHLFDKDGDSCWHSPVGQ